MREITIKIDCGEKTCDKCTFVWGTKTRTTFCGHFNDYGSDDAALTATDNGNYLRLPECLEAEKRVINAP
jgi:hypothetical protein